MNHSRKHPPSTIRNKSYRQAFERLDDALEKNDPWDNAAKIAAMRKAYFADVDAFDEIAIPERPKY